MVTFDKLVAGYFENWKCRSDDTFWAWGEVDALCNNLESGFEITRRLIESAEDDLYLGYIAAGPVEDLIVRHGTPAVALLEEAADSSPRVRESLAGVWLNTSHDAFPEWSRVMHKCGFVR
jgi:hypothetical protein